MPEEQHTFAAFYESFFFYFQNRRSANMYLLLYIAVCCLDSYKFVNERRLTASCFGENLKPKEQLVLDEIKQGRFSRNIAKCS